MSIAVAVGLKDSITHRHLLILIQNLLQEKPMAAFGRNQMGTLIVFQSSCINAKKSRIENLLGFRTLFCRWKFASFGTNGQSVDVSELAVFQPEHMGVGPSVFFPKCRQTNDRSHISIDDEPAVGDFDASFKGRPACAGSLGIVRGIGVCAALQAGTRDSPGAPWRKRTDP